MITTITTRVPTAMAAGIIASWMITPTAPESSITRRMHGADALARVITKRKSLEVGEEVAGKVV